MTNVTRNTKDVNEWESRLVPLKPGTKIPMHKAWNVIPPSEQRKHAKSNCNLAFLCGKGYVVIDGDNTATSLYLHEYLDERDVDFVLSKTARGRHFYLKARNVPDDFNWRRLKDGLDGELRANNALVVAPGSVVNGHMYAWEIGSIARWEELRWCDWNALVDLLLKNEEPAPICTVEIAKQDAPILAYQLLGELVTARKGQPIGAYPSRSEAEAAVVAMLHLSGWSYAEIEALFIKWRPGHYREKKDHQADYLRRTYAFAVRIVQGTPEREQLAKRYQEASLWDWPGRTGGTDRAVYIAAITLCYQFSTWEVDAPVRVLAERAAVGAMTVSRALYRLQENGYLNMARYHGLPDRGRTIVLLKHVPNTLPEIHPARRAKRKERQHLLHPLHSPPKTQTDTKNTKREKEPRKIDIISEAWAWGKLGKSPCLIYSFLTAEPRTAKELALLSGKGVDTVRRAAKRLEQYGLAKSEGKRPVLWQLGRRTLADAENDLDANLLAERRRERHRIDREKYRRKRASWLSNS